jgi:hypothetical protein
MAYEVEPLQQPIHKVVGRPPTPRLRLWRVEQMVRFLRQHAHEPIRTEPDAFPIRKVVGQPRQGRSDVAALKEIIARESRGLNAG